MCDWTDVPHSDKYKHCFGLNTRFLDGEAEQLVLRLCDVIPNFKGNMALKWL